MNRNPETPPPGKLIEGLRAGQSLARAAERILHARLMAVWYCLPAAAQRSDEDPEYVHQLRVTSRRAVEAVRLFRDLIPKSKYNELRDRLRQVRRAADDARNLDVLAEQFRCYGETARAAVADGVAGELQSRRRQAQEPITAIHRQLVDEQFDREIEKLLGKVHGRRRGPARKRFGRQAPRLLEPVVKKFFQAFAADLSNDAALHALRIQGKKLRYTMELLEVAFPPEFYQRFYPEIVGLQDLLGALNDYVTARTYFEPWLGDTQDAEQRAFLHGLLMAQDKARNDLRQAFFSFWTPERIAELQGQFERCCKK